MIFDKNLKGIVTVDPVEVTDGDGWKVNFALETHIRACYNGILPKFDQDLGNRVSVIFWQKTRMLFQNVGKKTTNLTPTMPCTVRAARVTNMADQTMARTQLLELAALLIPAIEVSFPNL